MTRRPRLALLALVPAFAAVALAACGDSDALAPVQQGEATPPDAGLDAEAPDTGAPDAPEEDGGRRVVVKRTLEHRNPFGNVAETGNLLWDGDFEWSSPFSDQYGWLKGTTLFNISYAWSGTTVGVACRSGLKCETLEAGEVVLGIGVASAGSKLDASFWVKPSSGACGDVTATLLSIEVGSDDADAPLLPAAETPDANGWCQFGAIADERLEKTYLYIENEGDGTVVLDDAVLKRAPKAEAISIAPRPPAVDRTAALAIVKASARKLREPRDPPPNAALRAFEEWAKK